MMDTSASMGIFEKYVARSFFFWMTRFLRSKYESVEIEFIAHHTEAKVVPEEAFFSRGESGGTICSSAYNKALELIEDRKSTRLNSSHVASSYAVFCLKKKNNQRRRDHSRNK